jgi:hypothetical protein
MPRQAFLLVSVEGFSEEDAAAILDVDQQKLQDLVDGLRFGPVGSLDGPMVLKPVSVRRCGHRLQDSLI